MAVRTTAAEATSEDDGLENVGKAEATRSESASSHKRWHGGLKNVGKAKATRSE